MSRRISALGSLFVRCLGDERGGETVEYALMLGLFGVAGYAVVNEVGVKIRMLWQRLDDALGAF